MSMDETKEEKLERLEKALLDQKLRAERHRSNFEALKAEHLILQESCQNKKLEYEILAENYDLLHHKSHSIIQQLQSERDQKIIECETLRTKVMSGAKLENYRAHLSAEAAEPYKKRADAAEHALNELREKYKNLKYDYVLLESNFDSFKLNQDMALKEITAKYKMELECLEESRKKLLANQAKDAPYDLSKIRKLERELTDVRQRMKALMAENEKVSAEKERAEEHSKQYEQGQSRQLAEVQYLNKSLELERSNLASQNQNLQADLTQSYERQHALGKKITSTERQLAESNRRLEEADHKLQMELADLEMKLAEQRQSLEREKESYRLELVSSKAQTQSMTEVLQKQDTMLAEKEQQLDRRVQQSREKEWDKQMALQQEKIDLEERVAELQREHSKWREGHEAKLDKATSALTDATSQADSLEADLVMTRAREQELLEKRQTLQQEVEAAAKINRKYQAVSAENRSLKALEVELKESFTNWEGTVERLEGQLRKVKQEAAMAEQQHQEDTRRARQSWVDERQVLTQRIEECETNMKSSGQQFEEARREVRKIQKQQRKQINIFKDKLELSSAEKKQLQSEREATVTALKLENKKLRRQLAEVQRKSKEFSFMLQTDPTMIPQTHPTITHRKDMVNLKLERELERVSGQVEELEACQAQQLQLEHQALLRAALDTQPPTSTHQLGHTSSRSLNCLPSESFHLPALHHEPSDHSLSQ